MRVTREQWINAAIDTLCHEGHMALSAERLARKLGVTRGSFYHHFEGMEAFHVAILKQWQNEQTTKIMDHAVVEEPSAELARLIEQTFNMSLALEIGINAWAGANPKVASFVADNETRRLNRLIYLYQQISNNEVKGKRLAKIAYYGLLGAAHATPRLSKEELRILILEVHELMMSTM